jgi:hypothetical protein
VRLAALGPIKFILKIIRYPRYDNSVPTDHIHWCRSLLWVRVWGFGLGLRVMVRFKDSSVPHSVVSFGTFLLFVRYRIGIIPYRESTSLAPLPPTFARALPVGARDSGRLEGMRPGDIKSSG